MTNPTIDSPTPNGHEQREPGVRTYRGRSLQELIPQIRDELGPDAIILRQREGLTGGVAGFFAQRCVEVDARPGATVDVYDDELDDLEDAEAVEYEEAPTQEHLDPLSSFAASLELAQEEPEALPPVPTPAPAPAARRAIDPGLVARMSAEAEKLAAAKRAAAEAAEAEEAEQRRRAEAEEQRRAEAEAQARAEELERSEQQSDRVARLEAELAAEREARRVAELEARLAAERAAREAAEREARLAAEWAARIESQPPPPGLRPRRGGLLAALSERYLNMPPASPWPAAAPVPAAAPAPAAQAPGPESSTAPAPAPEPAVPAPGAEPADPGASIVEELVATGMSEQSARRLVDDATRTGRGASGLRDRTRDALVAALKIADPPTAAGAGIAIVGAAGSGKTRLTASLAILYAAISHRAVTVGSLAGGEQDRELRELLRGTDVRFVELRRERALRSARREGLLILDTPAAGPEATATLGARLRALSIDDVYLALPATLSPQAAISTMRRYRALRPTGIAVTHVDESDQLGVAVELSLGTGVPLAFLHEGLDLHHAVSPAAPELVGLRVLPEQDGS